MKRAYLFFFLIIFSASSAQATLFTYDMVFLGGSSTDHSLGYGRIIADSEIDAIVSFGMTSTDATPGYAVDFFWEGVSPMIKTERFMCCDIVSVSPFTTTNLITGLPITLHNEFYIKGRTGGPYAHRLHDHLSGEFDTWLYFGEGATDGLHTLLRVTKVSEPSVLMLLTLSLIGLFFSRRGFI